MPSFCVVFKCGNNFNSDGDKSYYWLPAVVTRLGPLREKLSREKEREGVFVFVMLCCDSFVNLSSLNVVIK